MSKQYKAGQFIRIGKYLCRVTKVTGTFKLCCMECLSVNDERPCVIEIGKMGINAKGILQCTKLKPCYYPKIIRKCLSK